MKLDVKFSHYSLLFPSLVSSINKGMAISAVAEEARNSNTFGPQGRFSSDLLAIAAITECVRRPGEEALRGVRPVVGRGASLTWLSSNPTDDKLPHIQVRISMPSQGGGEYPTLEMDIARSGNYPGVPRSH